MSLKVPMQMSLKTTKVRQSFKPQARGVVTAYRSGLEEKLSKQLEDAGMEISYESMKIPYTKPESKHTYTPDFVLENGIIVESKGIFDSDDRKKHLLIQEQHPHYDIRFVFTRSKSPIYKSSKTTYADWCRKYGFQFADKVIPEAWLKEPMK